MHRRRIFQVVWEAGRQVSNLRLQEAQRELQQPGEAMVSLEHRYCP